MTENINKKPTELSDDDLDRVAGGVNINNSHYADPLAVTIDNSHMTDPLAVNIDNSYLVDPLSFG